MKLDSTDPLYFKIIAPELIGDIKFGSNMKIQGKLVTKIPKGLLMYLDRPRQSSRAEYLAAQGHDVSSLYDNTGILKFYRQQVPELGMINSGSVGQTFKVASIIFNPELDVTPKEYLEGINWLVKELAIPAKRPLYHGALVYYVSSNLSLVPVRDELSFNVETLPASYNSPIGKKKNDN